LRFNFLQTRAGSLYERLRNMKIDEATRTALTALSIAVGIILFSSGIEQVRLAQARASMHDANERLHADELRMSTLHEATDTVTKLARIARSVRAIQQSGARKAAELMELADRLPEHLWLTSLHQDGTEFLMQGNARSYAIVGDAMERLANARMVSNPELLSSSIRDNLYPAEVEYELRLQERTQ
jgi:Tfp pilus assembly protein PilN